MVECGGLENRCPPIGGPGVRIPLSPQTIKPTPAQPGFLFVVVPAESLLSSPRDHETPPPGGDE